MASTTTQLGSFYSEKFAASELRRYRKRGPIPSTRTLIEALKVEGVEGATLLDVGGGIGAIQHELLAAGVATATSVDASAAYLAAAREESDRRGHGGRVTYRHGDFVELAESVHRPTSLRSIGSSTCIRTGSVSSNSRQSALSACTCTRATGSW